MNNNQLLKMGWTRARSPKRSAAIWKRPPIMAAMPQPGWPAGPAGPGAGVKARRLGVLAPLRWHSEAVVVHTLAAMASRMALFITLPHSPGGLALGRGCPDAPRPGRTALRRVRL